MKRFKLLAVAAMAASFIAGCDKPVPETPSKQTSMVADKSSVTAGESVSVSVQNGALGAVAKWSVVPNTNVVLSRQYSWDQKNTIRFNQAGNYTVNVELKKVWCDSVAAAHPGMDT